MNQAGPKRTDESLAVSPIDSMPLVGNRYRPLRLLGRGAVGAVFLADDTRSAIQVALKLMPRRPAGPPGAQDPPDRELRAARRLDHPSIVAVLDAGSQAQHDWIVTELAAGTSLERYVQRARLLPEPLVLRTGARVAQALAHAHSRGVVHRDLKPSNVMLDIATGAVRVLDFGVARIDDGLATRTGMTLGTPSYMAPEQLAGASASPPSDAYSLGVLLFELFTGRRPHEGSNLGDLLRAVARGQGASLAALRPDLPTALVQAVESLLGREPSARPGDLDRLANRLDALAAEFESGRSPQGTKGRSQSP